MVLVESFSGVRGIYDKDLAQSIAVRYAHSFCSFVRRKSRRTSPKIVLGMDTRPSGLKLMNAIIGVAIVASAWAITYFVLTSLTSSIGK